MKLSHALFAATLAAGPPLSGQIVLEESVVSLEGGVRDATLCDLDGDGISDLVGRGPEGVAVLLGDGRGGFNLQATEEFESGGAFAVADFDGDGTADVAAADVDNNELVLLWSDGTGSFTDRTTLTFLEPPTSIAAGDVDGDGAIDLAVSTYDYFVFAEDATPGTTALFLNTGDGSFTEEWSIEAGFRPTVQLLDFDGDGHLDLVNRDGIYALAYVIESKIDVFLGAGDGSLAHDSTFSYWGGSPRFADFDEDGLLDFVANYFTDTVPGSATFLYLNDGRGEYEVAEAWNAGSHGFTLGDVNDDDHVDLVLARGSQVTVLVGDGTGSLIAHEYAAEGSPRESALGDIDGDNRTDVAVFDRQGLELNLYLNATPYFIRGDVNGDATVQLGDVAFFIAGITDNTIASIPCPDAADVNDDGVISIPDVLDLISALFLNRDFPATPYRRCGGDATEDTLTCESGVGCLYFG